MFDGMQEEIVLRVCYALHPLSCMQGDFVFKVSREVSASLPVSLAFLQSLRPSDHG